MRRGFLAIDALAPSLRKERAPQCELQTAHTGAAIFLRESRATHRAGNAETATQATRLLALPCQIKRDLQPKQAVGRRASNSGEYSADLLGGHAGASRACGSRGFATKIWDIKYGDTHDLDNSKGVRNILV